MLAVMEPMKAKWRRLTLACDTGLRQLSDSLDWKSDAWIPN